MRIDLIGEDDWAEFREVRLRSLLDAPEAFGSTYGEESSQTERGWREWAAGRWRGGAAAVYVARRGERAVGTATIAEYDAERGVAWIYAMWVAPDARGAGVGRALIDAAEGWARGRGCDHLVLSVTETNDVARRFYEACGFAEGSDRTPLREGSDLHVLRLGKSL